MAKQNRYHIGKRINNLSHLNKNTLTTLWKHSRGESKMAIKTLDWICTSWTCSETTMGVNSRSMPKTPLIKQNVFTRYTRPTWEHKNTLEISDRRFARIPYRFTRPSTHNNGLKIKVIRLVLGSKVCTALQNQDLVNWTKFIMGRVRKKRDDAQDEWIVRTSTKYKRSSQRWFTKSIFTMWEVSWKQW